MLKLWLNGCRICRAFAVRCDLYVAMMAWGYALPRIENCSVHQCGSVHGERSSCLVSCEV